MKNPTRLFKVESRHYDRAAGIATGEYNMYQVWARTEAEARHKINKSPNRKVIGVTATSILKHQAAY